MPSLLFSVSEHKRERKIKRALDNRMLLSGYPLQTIQNNIPTPPLKPSQNMCENAYSALKQWNYIFQTTGWTYPIWASSVEAHIRNKSITNRYYLRIRKSIERVREVTKEEEKFQQEERDRQQERLEEALNRHSKIRNTIQRMKIVFLPSAIFLITPILLSLFMLMVSNAFDPFWNFVFVSMVVLMSAFGIALLIMIVFASTVETSEKIGKTRSTTEELIRIIKRLLCMTSKGNYWLKLVIGLAVFIVIDFIWIIPIVRDIGVNLLADAIFSIFTIVFLSWLFNYREYLGWKAVKHLVKKG